MLTFLKSKNLKFFLCFSIICCLSNNLYAKNLKLLNDYPIPLPIATGSDLDIMNNSHFTISNEPLILSEDTFIHDGIKYKKGTLLGNFKLTGYCSCKKCTGTGKGITYSGKTVRANHTVAADLNVIPLNTFIILEGTSGTNVSTYDGVYQVEDKGGGVKDKHIDIYQATHELAQMVTFHGYSYANVYLAIPVE